ncbi:MAG: NADP-dependent malic enzyme [Patescibacteria group bacterium]|nr:NADP-dependent malic enzyme [Patescibacteria group bacterium]
MDIYEESLNLHKKNGGKIATQLKVALENKKDLSLAYSPGVAEVSRAISEDEKVARELTIKKNTVAIVSDGSAILGLGNLGAHAAIPVMEGKAALFKHFADVDAFPICVNTQDVDEIVELVKNIAPTFGGINLEDISAPRCFEVEKRLRGELDIPVMHDDQHGTAVVVLAGLINALKLRGSQKDKIKVVINGVGAAGVAITKILLDWGVVNIVLCDSQGIICHERTGLNDTKVKLMKVTNGGGVCGMLRDALEDADVFIGVSVANVLKPEALQIMNEKPIIFALANPEPEIMPNDAKDAGAFVVATGRSDFPNQVNNVLAFPGIFRGALDNGVVQFKDEMFVDAAYAIAQCVQNPTVDMVIPDPFDERVPKAVAQVIK